MPTDSRAGGARRSFQLGVLNGFFFTLAETLMDPTLVLVAFVSHLTGSPVWLGLVVPLREGGWYLPQLWISGFLQSWPRKIEFYKRMAVVRVTAWILLVVAVFVLRDPGQLLLAFFVTYGLYSVAAGFSGLAFLEIVSKTIPPRRRGLFFAWRLITGGLAAVGAGAFVRWILDDANPLPFPHNFGLVFAISLPLAALGLASFALVDEPPDPAPRARASPLNQLRRAGHSLRGNANFRRLLYLQSALLIAGAATPFFAVYVQQKLGGPLGMVGLYLAVYTVARLLATMALARLTQRWSNRQMMSAAAVAGVLMTGLVLALALAGRGLRVSGTAASLWLLPAFALSGVRAAGIGVASQSLLLEIAPPEERTLYVGFTNTFLGIVLLGTALSGLVVARFGFEALFALTLAAHLVAVTSALRMRDVADGPPPDGDVNIAAGGRPATG